MKVDYKMLLNTAIGVAVGMVAYHFISKAINGGSSSGETAGAFGRMSRKSTRPLFRPSGRAQYHCGGNPAICKEGCEMTVADGGYGGVYRHPTCFTGADANRLN